MHLRWFSAIKINYQSWRWYGPMLTVQTACAKCSSVYSADKFTIKGSALTQYSVHASRGIVQSILSSGEFRPNFVINGKLGIAPFSLFCNFSKMHHISNKGTNHRQFWMFSTKSGVKLEITNLLHTMHTSSIIIMYTEYKLWQVIGMGTSFLWSV